MTDIRFKIQRLLTWAHSAMWNSPKTESSMCYEDTSLDKSYRERHRGTSDSTSAVLTLWKFT